MLFFLEFSLPCWVSTEFGSKIFLCLSRPISLAKNKAGKRFLKFVGFFCNFYWSFHAGVEYKRNSGLKFFTPFLGQSHSVLAKNIARKRLFIILNFFFLFRNSLNRVEYERNSGLRFFFLFLGLSHPFLPKNNAGMRFFNLLNFLLFFAEFLAQVEYERNSWLKFFSLFLGLTHPDLVKNNVGKGFFSFLNFFCYFFRNFLPQAE